MLTEMKGNWGLGPALFGEGTARRFGHDGVNEGFQSTMIAYVERGDEIMVLTNGGQGRRLADEIVRAVAADYWWTELAAPCSPLTHRHIPIGIDSPYPSAKADA